MIVPLTFLAVISSPTLLYAVEAPASDESCLLHRKASVIEAREDNVDASRPAGLAAVSVKAHTQSAGAHDSETAKLQDTGARESSALVSNLTFAERVQKEIEFEVSAPSRAAPVKNKLVLLMLE